MPPVMEGEVRELGSTIHSRLVPIHNQMRQAWIDRDNWRRESQVEIPQETKRNIQNLGLDRELEIPQVIENISKYIGLQPHNTVGSTRQMKRGDYVLAPDIPVVGVEEGMIGFDDPRVSLRGNKKIVATRDLPRCHVVGVHRGVVRLQKEHELLANTPPTAGRFRDSIEWEGHVESFTWADPVSGDYDVVGEDGTRAPLYNCSVGYGNLCCLANDPKILSPFWNRDEVNGEQLTEEEEKRLYDRCESVAEENCTMFPVLIRGFPHIFLVTIKEVSQGSELLYAYQAGYWSIQYQAGYWSFQYDLKRKLDLDSDGSTESLLSLPHSELMEVEGGSLKNGSLEVESTSKKPKRINYEVNRRRPPPSYSLHAVIKEKKQRRC